MINLDYIYNHGLEEVRRISKESKMIRDIAELAFITIEFAWDHELIPKLPLLLKTSEFCELGTMIYRASFKPVLIVGGMMREDENGSQCLDTISKIAKTVKDIFKSADAWECLGMIDSCIWVRIGLGGLVPQIPLIITICSVTRSVIKSIQAWQAAESQRNQKLDVLQMMLNEDPGVLQRTAFEKFVEYRNLAGANRDASPDTVEMMRKWDVLLAQHINPFADPKKVLNSNEVNSILFHGSVWLHDSESMKEDPIITLARESVEFALISLAARQKDSTVSQKVIHSLIQGKENRMYKERFKNVRHVLEGILGCAAIVFMVYADRNYKVFSAYSYFRKLFRVVGHFVNQTKPDTDPYQINRIASSVTYPT